MSGLKNKQAARSVADLNAGVILAAVEIAAPPERVFRALTSSEVTKWWGTPEEYVSTGYEAELRVGGKWKSVGRGSNGPFFVGGEFLEIDPPHKLVQTWRPSWDESPPTTVTYRLDAIPGGTRVTLRHEGFGERKDACADHGRGWEKVFGWLDAYLSRESVR